MEIYKYSIPLRVDRAAAVKYLNDKILSGIRKGYSHFVIGIEETQTYPNICAPIAGVLDYYSDEGNMFEIAYQNPFGYIMHTKLEQPQIVRNVIGRDELHYPFDKVWMFSSSEEINELVTSYILTLRQADIIKPGVISSLEWCLNETMDNVLQHSDVDKGYAMAQLHKTSQQLSICVFDAGRGIYNSLKESRHKPSSPLDAITLALQEKVTRDENIGQGNGLWGLSQIIKEAHGSIEISSGGAVYKNQNGYIHTIENGHFNLGKLHGTALIDFQLNYSNEINVAKALNGYEPVDLWLEEFEAENGDVIIPIAEQANGTGTRKSAERLRTMVLNMTLADKKHVILDFSGVNLLSSSFADELVGKIISKYGFVFFINHFSIRNLSVFNASLLNRSVQQRMAQMYYDNTIKDAEDLCQNC